MLVFHFPPSSQEHAQSQIRLSILASFRMPFGILFLYFLIKFWDAFLNATFSIFIPKWLPKWSDQKALRKLLGAPGRQRRPKGLSKTNSSPRAFLNRMPDGGLDAPRTVKVSLFASILVHSGSILASNLASLSNLLASFSNVFRDLFLVTSLRGGISRQSLP